MPRLCLGCRAVATVGGAGLFVWILQYRLGSGVRGEESRRHLGCFHPFAVASPKGARCYQRQGQLLIRALFIPRTCSRTLSRAFQPFRDPTGSKELEKLGILSYALTNDPFCLVSFTILTCEKPPISACFTRWRILTLFSPPNQPASGRRFPQPWPHRAPWRLERPASWR
jgi:hypothetical protein